MREVLGASDDEVVELVRQEALDEDEGLDDPMRQAGFAVVARGAVAEWVRDPRARCAVMMLRTLSRVEA